MDDDTREGERPREPVRSPPRSTTAFVRRKPAQGVIQLSTQPTVVFLTVCVRDRGRFLATNENHDALVAVWRDDATHWHVGRYVVMPDHIHLFAAPSLDAGSLENWIRYWKRRFVERRKLPARFFQSGAWDTRMRSRTHYAEKWDCVFSNPVRSGLVNDGNDWPYIGEIHGLEW